MDNTKKIIITVLCVAVIVLIILFLSGMVGRKSYVVGKDIKAEDITEFYFTEASSTYPPEYQRYKFSADNGKYVFTHEKREGDRFPLTEEDVTVTGSFEMTKDQWDCFLELIRDGEVEKRKEAVSSGASGPYVYLYWKKDRSVYQKFSFCSYEKMQAFSDFCDELTDNSTNY